jgi:hypothetical protein
MEREMYAVFSTDGAPLLLGAHNSWEILAEMQHHNVPTRLLDWTESLHTALFFACIHSSREPSDLPESPCLWVLNPYNLSRIATGKAVIFDEGDKRPFDYREAIFDGPWPTETPFAMGAPWRNDRLRAQRGGFTVHGRDTNAIECMAKGVSSCVKCLPVSPAFVEDIRCELTISGSDHFQLFPDLDGLAQRLRWQVLSQPEFFEEAPSAATGL